MGVGCRGRNGTGGRQSRGLGWRVGPGSGGLGTTAELRLLSRFPATQVSLKTEILKTWNDTSREGGGKITVLQISRSSDIQFFKRADIGDAIRGRQESVE
jgi:hypothetical protein